MGVLGGETSRWRRMCDGTATSDDVLLIEPVVDMFNHKTRALCETNYDASSDRITLRSAKDWHEVYSERDLEAGRVRERACSTCSMCLLLHLVREVGGCPCGASVHGRRQAKGGCSRNASPARLRLIPAWACGQGQEVFICYGCKGNRALLKSYGFVEDDNPVDFTIIPGGVARARAVFDQAGRGREGGGDKQEQEIEAEWRKRIQMLSQAGLLAHVHSLEVGLLAHVDTRGRPPCPCRHSRQAGLLAHVHSHEVT
jgi:hypothetical protein